MKLNTNPRLPSRSPEYDSFRETHIKHVWIFIKPNDAAHYQFADETATFHEEHYDTIEECEKAMKEYVIQLEDYSKNLNKEN